MLAGMRTLLTGAGGQVGLDLARALVAAGDDVHASDVKVPPHVASAVEGVSWHVSDVTDASGVRALIDELKPERIFHLAAILSARGEAMPDVTWSVNMIGLYNVLEAARMAGTRQVMFTSTIAVFGPGLPRTVADDVPLLPTTMYGVTKGAGEMLGHYYRLKYDLDFRAVRFPGLISASVPGGGTSDYSLWMYVDAVRKGHYTAFCRADSRIPLMYMPDGLRALLELSSAPRDALTRTTYNIAGFSPTAEEIGQSIQRMLPNARFDWAPDPLRQGILDSWPAALDDTRARADWGWRPHFDLDAMTDDLLPRIRELVERDPAAFERA